MRNSLLDHVVDVNSLKQFETRLDKFWRNQDVMFDWTAIGVNFLQIVEGSWPFPSPPLPSPPFPSPPLSSPPLPSLPLSLEVGPQIQLGDLGERAVSSPSGLWGRAPAKIEFGAF